LASHGLGPPCISGSASRVEPSTPRAGFRRGDITIWPSATRELLSQQLRGGAADSASSAGWNSNIGEHNAANAAARCALAAIPNSGSSSSVRDDSAGPRSSAIRQTFRASGQPADAPTTFRAGSTSTRPRSARNRGNSKCRVLATSPAAMGNRRVLRGGTRARSRSSMSIGVSRKNTSNGGQPARSPPRGRSRPSGPGVTPTSTITTSSGSDGPLATTRRRSRDDVVVALLEAVCGYRAR